MQKASRTSGRRYTLLAATCLALAIVLTVATVVIVFYCIEQLNRGPVTAPKMALHGTLLKAAGVGAALSLLMVVKAAFFVFHARRLHMRELAEAMTQFSSGDFMRQVVPSGMNSLAAGDIADVRSNFTDMTERISEKVKQLTDAEERLRSSVAELSHDLRTPLSLLRGYVETMLSKGADLSMHDQQNYLRIALRHAARLERLISELFELTELDSPAVQLERGPVALDDLIEDVTREFSLRADATGVRITRTRCEKLPPVDADARLIERVFENLIDNALRFTPGGGQVEVSCRLVANAIETEVRDTGQGIAPEDLPFVFHRFYRSKELTKHVGSGLGLAIVSRILQLHGTEIRVHSEPSTGTAFTFTLPLASR